MIASCAMAVEQVVAAIPKQQAVGQETFVYWFMVFSDKTAISA
jgi:hypothetical protein